MYLTPKRKLFTFTAYVSFVAGIIAPVLWLVTLGLVVLWMATIISRVARRRRHTVVVDIESELPAMIHRARVERAKTIRRLL